MWTNPNTTTPSIVQLDFGPWGQNIPGDGEEYCGPTAMVMGLYWLASNGFTQLAAAVYNGQDDPVATNLERIVAGLVQTSSVGGTSSASMATGIANYLSACGIAPSEYVFSSTDNPDLTWLANQLAPNVAANPTSIVLANFSVGWFELQPGSTTVFTNSGGHVLAPLTVDSFAEQITINNPEPETFENTPNLPSSNPQTVGIASVPSGWTLPNLSLPSQNYSQVITPTLGQGGSYAILWGGQAWAISSTALPSTPGYSPSTWTITQSTPIDTNGGMLTVIAPLAGTGGLQKSGEGTMLLSNTNQSSGANRVCRGVLASTQTSGTPFGTGAMTLTGGGTLALQPDGPATVTIASGNGSTCTVGRGGALRLVGVDAIAVTIGGNIDGVTANIDRSPAGTLIIAVGAGALGLGSTQQVFVAGAASNLPVVSNGIVAPYVLGQEFSMRPSGLAFRTASWGFFLTYGNSAGFEAATTVSSAGVGINAVARDAVYHVVDNQTINAGKTVQVAALELTAGEINGSPGTTLLVGSQASGDIAGVIMNSGTIAAGTIKFGRAEGLIYSGAFSAGLGFASDDRVTIDSTISGASGLTLFGPGTLVLTADNSASLAGQVSVNSGTLIAANAAGSSATGSGEVVVNSDAILVVSGSVGGPVTVDEFGTLFLNGGTVSGSVTVAPTSTSSPAPGGILQGAGTIVGAATVKGIIQSGPQAGILQFVGDVTIAGEASFYWRLQALVDNTSSAPGVGWNAVQFSSANSNVGTDTNSTTFFLDFSELDGDPDGGDPFWSSAHTWSLMMFPSNPGSCWCGGGNFNYQSGNFTLSTPGSTVFLTWTPAA